ncbi:MAG TPA: hypothetical protein PLZ55_07510 [bacterium]|nr:hypothetical protein [bacterium]
MECAMEDYVGLLVFFAIIIVNFLISLSQKAKAEKRRADKSSAKTPQAPKGKPIRESAKARPTIRPERPVQPRRREAGRSVSAETVQPIRQQAQEGTRRTKDIIREWSKRLEEAFDLETMETKWEGTAPESPAGPEFASVEKQPSEVSKTPKTIQQKPSFRPAVSKTSAHYATTVRRSSVEFLGRMHPNPIVNGIILSEILSKPVSIREE